MIRGPERVMTAAAQDRRLPRSGRRIARRWSVVMAVQFAVGAVTGTILSFEFGILWPRLMGRFGAALGLGFAIEGLAFFLEAIFIGIYLYGWTRLRPKTHFLLGLALPPAGVLGPSACSRRIPSCRRRVGS